MAEVRDFSAILYGPEYRASIGLNTPTILTYSFPDILPDYFFLTQEQEASFIAPSDEFKNHVRACIELFASASGLTFFEVPAGKGDINFVTLDLSLFHIPGLAGLGYVPYDGWTEGTGSDVLIDYGAVAMDDVILHEIGHALGLKHAAEGQTTLAADLLDDQLTLMHGSVPGPVGGFGLGSLDIQAMQYLYGAPDKDGTQFASWSWDAATYTLTQVSLPAGGRMRGTNVNDIITGSAFADSILAFGGNDSIIAGTGNDTILAGEGNDTIIAGSGGDLIYVTGGRNVIEAGDGYDYIMFTPRTAAQLLAEPSVIDGGADGGSLSVQFVGDAPLNVQALVDAGWKFLNLSLVSFSFTGNGDSVIVGSAMDETLYGGFGNNSISGGGGNDELTGTTGNDTLDGGPGDDLLRGGGGADILLGGSGNDHFALTIDADAPFDAGNLIDGGDGVDALQLIIGSGSTFAFSSLQSSIQNIEDVSIFFDPSVTTSTTGGGGRDRIYAGSSSATDGDVVTIRGMGGNDILNGNLWRDSLDGGDGNDELYGNSGDDTLFGGAGNDTVFGADGADVFRFAAAGSGDDWLHDFEVSMDRFDLSGARFTAALEHGSYTRLTYSGGTIEVQERGLTLSQWNDLIDGASVMPPESTGANNRMIIQAGQSAGLIIGAYDVFGTNAGRESLTIHANTTAILQGDFTRGGDTISLTGPAGDFTGQISGSSLILRNTVEGIEARIPIGTVGITLQFEDGSGHLVDTRVMKFNGTAVVIGDQVFSGSVSDLSDYVPPPALAPAITQHDIAFA